MSQEALALAAGFSRKNVADIEAGRKNPQLHTLLRLIRGLGLQSLEQLLSGIAEWGSNELADMVFSPKREEKEEPPASA